MDNLKFGIFDIFTYLLPGGVIAFYLLIGIDSCYCDAWNIKQFFDRLRLDTNTAILAIVGVYLIGIVCQYFGSKLFHGIRIYIWKKERPTFLGLSGAEFHVLLREYSPRNFVYIELYLALRGMSHNMAFAFGFGGIVSIYKLINCNNSTWAGCLILSLLFAVVFLFRARMFHEWYYEDGIAAVKTLKLNEKVSENSSSQNPN